jgi:4-amino-4-deoxy-L-arabinose transferase-like glycosyltransferase
MTESKRSNFQPRKDPWRRWEWVLLVLILCLAALLRLWNLDSIPPGLTHDEAGHGQDSINILRGARPLYETVGYGREPLYDYVVAGAMAISGRASYLELRAVSAIFGLLTIVTTYLWVRQAFGRWEALLTCAWLAGSFWAVSVSRQALRSTLLPAFLGAAACAWWRGAFSSGKHSRASWLWFVLSGLFIAATLWTYMAARVTWLLFLALPIYLLLTDTLRFKRHFFGMLLTLVVAGLVAAPMFVWLLQHPGAEQRFTQLDQPLRSLIEGDLKQIWSNSLGTLGMFTVRADDLWMYNLSGRPWLGAVEGVLFCIGVLLALWQWKRPRHMMVLLWLVAGSAPSIVTGVSASATRAVAILPVLYVFPAVGLVACFKWLEGRIKGRWVRVIFVLAAAFLVLTVGVQTYSDYFVVWANERDVRVAYHTTLFEVARDLDRQAIPPGTVVVLSSIYPGRFHDPYALDLMMERSDLSLRWVDGRGALVFPDAPSRLVVKALAPLDSELERVIKPPYARLIEERHLRSDDLNPGFSVYEWDSVSALEALRALAVRQPAGWSNSSIFPVDDPQSLYQPLDLPANLGGVVALEGYELSAQAVAPGDTITLVTYWRVLSVPDVDLDVVLFTHLLSPSGDPSIIAQQDRLDAPAWNWKTGEVFAQVHRLTIDQVPSGHYLLEVGAYTRGIPSPIEPNPPAARLPLYIDGQSASDRILLSPVEIYHP